MSSLSFSAATRATDVESTAVDASVDPVSMGIAVPATSTRATIDRHTIAIVHPPRTRPRPPLLSRNVTTKTSLTPVNETEGSGYRIWHGFGPRGHAASEAPGSGLLLAARRVSGPLPITPPHRGSRRVPDALQQHMEIPVLDVRLAILYTRRGRRYGRTGRRRRHRSRRLRVERRLPPGEARCPERRAARSVRARLADLAARGRPHQPGPLHRHPHQ